jgi:hypothetical protein
MKLIKAMFGLGIFGKPGPSPIEGVHTSQMREDGKIGHNLSWYNKAGEKIGWGDIAIHDIEAFQMLMDPDDLLIFVSEYESHWDLPKHLHPDAPGIEFVGEKATKLISKVDTFRIVDEESDKPFTITDSVSQMTFLPMQRIQFKRLLQAAKDKAITS